ncbi:hypothetical protein EV424DRAFT_1443453 [Suillus variegatus]|nr:hypothetical protein EV424DRAFT_1443453 [Suillus variegatus]
MCTGSCMTRMLLPSAFVHLSTVFSHLLSHRSFDIGVMLYLHHTSITESHIFGETQCHRTNSTIQIKHSGLTISDIQMIR